MDRVRIFSKNAGMISQTRSGLEDYFMTKTSEFHTLLRNYRGIMGNIRINKIWISFDSSTLQDRKVLLPFLLSFPTTKSMKKIYSKTL